MRSSALVLVALAAAPAFAQRPNQGEDESAVFVDQGRAALRSGDLAAAAKELDQAIVLNPRRIEAYVLRGAVFTARKQYKDGIALMRRAQALAPDDLDVLTALGSELVLSGDATTGVPMLQQVVGKEPARYDVQLLLGLHWHAVGSWADAITALEGYFQYRPTALAAEDARQRIILADAYLRARQPQKALPLFQAAQAANKADLRARIGVAWAMAAIDCKQARPLLRELEAVAEQHPEVWLVDGQCALTLGDAGGALAEGRRYLERDARSAAGHALVGEALAARGNLADARGELETARSLEPARRRWTVRLASVLRRAGHVADAVEVLDKLGPPDKPASDRDWWDELGEALLAQGDVKVVAQRLGPIAPDLGDDAIVHTVLGAAQLALGELEAAVKTLDQADTIQSTPRSKKLLSAALTAVAAGKLSANDPTAAEPMLARAEQLDGNGVVWRDRGIALLALGKPADAVPVLDRAAKADASPIVAMLDARAHAMAGDLEGARPMYERALATEKDNGVEISLDWAASELASGDPAIAVTTLERTAGAAKTGPLAARHKAALADARHATALVLLRAGNGAKALELLRESAAGSPTLAARCDLAVVSVAAGDAKAALAALRAISGQSCPFPPPADTEAAPILSAFTDGLDPRRAGRALDRLTALGGKSTGPAAAMLGTAIRVVALNAAQDAYRSGQLAAARKYLATAKAANARAGADEVAHDLAVLDLADGKVDVAIPELEKLASRVPEALVNLGIAYERRGDHVRALDAWRRARKANVRFAPLGEWIEAKERIYGEAP